MPGGHEAIDVSHGMGAPILCLGDGVIHSLTIATPLGVANSVAVDHRNGWMSRYVHLLDIPTWNVGQTIRQGDLIGLEDTTGLANGPHLHLVLTYVGSAVDPMAVLFAGPDLAVPSPQPQPAPQAGDPSPALSLSELQQMQALFANGTVVFPMQLTPANGDERYHSIKDGVPRLLPAGTLTRGYAFYVPLESQP